MEDRQVYVNIHKLGLYRVACRYPSFPCMNIIQWVVSHTDPEMMTLKSTSGKQLVTFRKEKYHHMHHLLQLLNYMVALFFTPNKNVNSRHVLKCWVKEPSKFETTPNQVYKTRSLWKAYLLLVTFACCRYGQESTRTFPQSWVVRLD